MAEALFYFCFYLFLVRFVMDSRDQDLSWQTRDHEVKNRIVVRSRLILITSCMFMLGRVGKRGGSRMSRSARMEPSVCVNLRNLGEYAKDMDTHLLSPPKTYGNTANSAITIAALSSFPTFKIYSWPLAIFSYWMRVCVCV